MVAVPVTRQVKRYPFEVELPSGLPVGGVVLADQMKSLDWRARKAKLICALPEPVIREVLRRAAALLS